MGILTAFFEGANYRRLKQSLASQRATEANMDAMLRLAVARNEGERQAIAGEIIGERNGRIAHASHVRQTTAGLIVGAALAVFVGVAYLPADLTSPVAPAAIASAIPDASPSAPAVFDGRDLVFGYGFGDNHPDDMSEGLADRAVKRLIADCRLAAAQDITVVPVEYSMTIDRIVQDQIIQAVEVKSYNVGNPLSYTDAAKVLHDAPPPLSALDVQYNYGKRTVAAAVSAAHLSKACPASDGN